MPVIYMTKRGGKEQNRIKGLLLDVTVPAAMLFPAPGVRTTNSNCETPDRRSQVHSRKDEISQYRRYMSTYKLHPPFLSCRRYTHRLLPFVTSSLKQDRNPTASTSCRPHIQPRNPALKLDSGHLSFNLTSPENTMADHQYKFNISMSCGGCSGAVERVLKKLEGTQTFPVWPELRFLFSRWF